MPPRRPQSLTALASMTHGILRWAERQGIPSEALISPENQALVEQAGDSGRVPLELHDSVWHRVEVALADPSFGLRSASSILDVSSFGLLGLLAMTQSTIGESFARSVKFSRVLKDDVNARLVTTDREIVIELWTSQPPMERARAIADASLYAFRHFAETWTGGVVVPKAVFFRHPKPASAAGMSEYERFGAAVHFEHVVDAIAFDRAVAAVPLPTAQPEVARYLEMTANDWLARFVLDSKDVTSRVRASIHEALVEGEGQWEIQDVARRLGMSARTLQRALAGEGVTYRHVLDEARWAIAGPLVASKAMPLERVAEQLGYADGKAFRRAFRRWAGVAPVELRRSGRSERSERSEQSKRSERVGPAERADPDPASQLTTFKASGPRRPT